MISMMNSNRRAQGRTLFVGLLVASACGLVAGCGKATGDTGAGDTGTGDTGSDGPWSSGNVVAVGDVATAVWLGGPASGAGYAVALGDVDGTPGAEVVVGAPYLGGYEDGVALSQGVVYVVDSSDDGGSLVDRATAALWVEDTTNYDRLGATLAAGQDVDGDGYGDLLIGAPDQAATADELGAAYLVRGPIVGDVMLDRSADASLVEGTDRAGSGLAFGDFDGDGSPDFAIGLSHAGSSPSAPGQVWVFDGQVTGSLSAKDAIVQFRGEEDDDGFGDSIAQVGDFNGDGISDSAFGASRHGSEDDGQVYVVFGPRTGSVAMSDADRILTTDHTGSGLGRSVVAAGDLDEDGLADVLVGADKDSTVETWAGLVVLIQGGTVGSSSVDDAPLSVSGEIGNDRMGSTIVPQADIDGDGHLDLVVGAVGIGGGASPSPGKVYVFPGPIAGHMDPALDSQWVLQGTTVGEGLGMAIGGTDVDGDGSTDLLVGSPYRYSDAEGWSGAVSLIYSQDLP